MKIRHLAPKHPGKRLRDIVDRLKCRRCGEPPARITLADGMPGMARRAVRKVELLMS